MNVYTDVLYIMYVMCMFCNYNCATVTDKKIPGSTFHRCYSASTVSVVFTSKTLYTSAMTPVLTVSTVMQPTNTVCRQCMQVWSCHYVCVLQLRDMAYSIHPQVCPPDEISRPIAERHLHFLSWYDPNEESAIMESEREILAL
jgi:hypothetical protein